MTADKGFKKLVRRRMLQTGQSYAAARQSLRQPERRSPTMATRHELHESMAAMQTTIREYLAPIAEQYDKPLDPGLVSAMMFELESPGEGEPKSWVVHLYTLSPGLVIGKKGMVVQDLRNRLCEVSGDSNLRLNLIDFAKIHAARHELAGAPRATA